MENQNKSSTATNEFEHPSSDSQKASVQFTAMDSGAFHRAYSKRLKPKINEKTSMRAKPTRSGLSYSPHQKNMDTKTIRDLEDHYQKGVGIRMGPTVEFAKGNYVVGESDMSVNFGVLGDFIVSPSLSFETGIKYLKRYYELADQQDLVDSSLPGVDESIGALQKAEIDSWMLEIPVMLKYRYPLSLKSHILGGAGYSALYYWKQLFEYDYSFSGGGDAFTVGSVYETKEHSFYSGSLNITLGVSNQLKNHKTLETSLFYQRGIGSKGVEKTNANFFGIRGVYWFTLR
jgi:hypothetical protein